MMYNISGIGVFCGQMASATAQCGGEGEFLHRDGCHLAGKNWQSRQVAAGCRFSRNANRFGRNGQ
jgi:hypothetical protein